MICDNVLTYGSLDMYVVASYAHFISLLYSGNTHTHKHTDIHIYVSTGKYNSICRISI